MAMAATTERPTARLRDPSTSHEAGEAMRESGEALRHREIILATLRAHPAGLTSDEIAAHSGLGRVAVARRMAELRDQLNLVYVRGYATVPEKRHSSISGRKGMVFRPVPAEPEQKTLAL